MKNRIGMLKMLFSFVKRYSVLHGSYMVLLDGIC